MTVQPVPSRRSTELAPLQALIGPERTSRMADAAATLRQRLDGGTLWHVNSTPTGGGVAEMLQTLLPLYEELGVQTGWMVIRGNPKFFAVTKRLGNALYGQLDSDTEFGPAERGAYVDTLSIEADRIRQHLQPKDIVVLHDHQTVGLVEIVAGLTSATYWRCHVGIDEPNSASQVGWDFLAPFLSKARGVVFSVREHVPDFLMHTAVIVPPFISPFSTKNRVLEQSVIDACLIHAGLRDRRTRHTSGPGPSVGKASLRHAVRTVGGPAPGAEVPLLVQVSRWDRLKDMEGVLTSFSSYTDAGHLALVGPDPAAIPDDTEQSLWYGRCRKTWSHLSPSQRKRISLVCLPMENQDENALLVNAAQRAAGAVLQKSLAEGFGLTVTEAMFKGRVVIASAVGGIRDQITHQYDGLLVDDPYDLRGFGDLMASAAAGGVDSLALGTRARSRVVDNFLPDGEIVATARMVSSR